MFRWFRRDRRLALLFLLDLLLVGLVTLALILLLWPRNPDITASPGAATPGINSGLTPGSASLTTRPAIGFEEATPSPLPPTVNPTKLVALPNQGQNEAPPPPPGGLGQGTAVSGASQSVLPTPTPRR
jgi:hypothetical protein